MTFILRENCQDYRLLDILSHDQHLKEKVKDFLFEEDWFNFPIKSPLDIVIANDFFPNVDQRLDIFLKRFIPVCSEIRASFTFYNNNRFYLTKRADAEENLIFYAYNGEMLRFILEKYQDRIEGFSSLKNSFSRVNNSDSVYQNKRHVLICKIKGDLY